MHLRVDVQLDWPLKREMRNQKRRLSIRKRVLVGYKCLLTSTVKAGGICLNNTSYFPALLPIISHLSPEMIGVDYQKRGQSRSSNRNILHVLFKFYVKYSGLSPQNLKTTSAPGGSK